MPDGSPEDRAEMEETLAVFSDPEALADIREADAAYAAGEVVRGRAAVRALRAGGEDRGDEEPGAPGRDPA